MKQQCDHCVELYAQGMFPNDPSRGRFVCKSCMHSCKDSCYHKACIVEHLKVCNKTIQVQRAFTAAKKQREQTEAKLESARGRLVAAQQDIQSLEKDIQSLETDLECQRKGEAKAEKELQEQFWAGSKQE